MTMQADLRSRLLGATAAGSRVYWLSRPQASALPAITLQTISGGLEQNLKGFEEMQQSRVQLDVWATSYDQMIEVFNAAVAALAPPTVQGGTTFSRMMFDPPRDLLERTDTQEVFRKSVDLIVHHSTA